MRALVVKM